MTVASQFDADLQAIQDWQSSDAGQTDSDIHTLWVLSQDLLKDIRTRDGAIEARNQRATLEEIRERIDLALFATRPLVEAAE